MPDLTLTLAHVGHWLADLLYVAPVLVLVGWIAIRAIIDRRRGDDEPPAPASPA